MQKLIRYSGSGGNHFRSSNPPEINSKEIIEAKKMQDIANGIFAFLLFGSAIGLTMLFTINPFSGGLAPLYNALICFGAGSLLALSGYGVYRANKKLSQAIQNEKYKNTGSDASLAQDMQQTASIQNYQSNSANNRNLSEGGIRLEGHNDPVPAFVEVSSKPSPARVASPTSISKGQANGVIGLSGEC